MRKMAWQTPKTNWKISDFFNYSDYNRIVGNMEIVRADIEDVIGENTDEYKALPANKGYNSILYAEEMNEIWDNLVLLDSLFCEEGIRGKKTYTINGSTPTFEDFNAIEQYLLEYHDWLQQIKDDDTRPSISVEVTTDFWVNMPSWHLDVIVADGGNALSKAVLTFNDTKYVYNDPGATLEIEDDFVLKEGINKFKIKAFDDSDFPRIEEFTMKYDANAPSLSVTSASGYINSSSYTLKGKAVDTVSGLKEVTIDGTKVTVASDGTFSKTFTVNGTKTFKVVAKDNAGNSRTVNHTVTLENTNPTVSITSAGNYRTVNNSYRFTATVSDSQSGIASITINGVNYTVASGTKTVNVSKDFTLTVGINTFTIIAEDLAGHTTQSSVSLTYMAPNTVVVKNGTVTGDYWENWPQSGGKVDSISVNQNGTATISYYCDGYTGGNVSVDVHTPFKLTAHQEFAGKSRVRINGIYSWDGNQFGSISGYTATANGVNVTSKISALTFSDSQSTGPGFDISRLTDTEKVNLVITGTLNSSTSATAHGGWADITAQAIIAGTVTLS